MWDGIAGQEPKLTTAVLPPFPSTQTWLNQNIHEVGSLYATGDDLLKAVTGSKLDPQVYLNHLTSKYSVAYGLCSAEQGEAGCVFHFN